MLAAAQQWAARAVQSDHDRSLEDAVYCYNQAASNLEHAIRGEPDIVKQQQAQRVIQSYRERAGQLAQLLPRPPAAPSSSSSSSSSISSSFASSFSSPSLSSSSAPLPPATASTPSSSSSKPMRRAPPPPTQSMVRAQDVAHCEDAASEALIRAMLEEDQRALDLQRRGEEERKSADLAAKLAREEEQQRSSSASGGGARGGVPPQRPASAAGAGADTRSKPALSSTSSTSSLSSPSASGAGNSNLLEYLDLQAPSSAETVVETITLRVGGRSFHGSFSIPTHMLQKYLRQRFERGKLQMEGGGAAEGWGDGGDGDGELDGEGQGHGNGKGGGKGGKAGGKKGLLSDSANNPFLDDPQGTNHARSHNSSSSNHHNDHSNGATINGPASFEEAAATVGVGAHGDLAQGRADYHQDTAVQRPDSFDSGTFYREFDWDQAVRQPSRARGPPHVPKTERISLAERQKNIEMSRESLRVNPPSDRRLYPLDGYELESYIDPRRTIDVPIAKSTAPKAVRPQATHAAVLFETASVGAKIRNVHKMGGERIKEMDHFVASVETPVVSVKIPDIAPFVVDEACAGARPVVIRDEGGPWSLGFAEGVGGGGGGGSGSAAVVAAMGSLAIAGGATSGPTGSTIIPAGVIFVPAADVEVNVQSHLRDDSTPLGVAEEVAVCAKVFYRLLRVVCEQFLLHIPLSSIRMYYMVTVRADACVCQRSKRDNLIYVNLMVFQQQAAFDPRTLAITGGRRVWQYWLQRLAMAAASGDSSVSVSGSGSGGGVGAGRPTGLYDPEVRRRFRAFAQALPPPPSFQAPALA